MDIFDAVHAVNEHEARAAAERAGNRAGLVEQRLAAFETKFARLALVTHALWELLKDRHGYTEDELNDWVNLTDLKDGHLDGRVRHTAPPANCHKCGRVVTRALGRCIYCGEVASSGDAFDRVH